MKDTPAAPGILIVDEDVGFVWWLGELFHEAGFESVPALSCKEALSLARHVKSGIDLLLINPGLRGASRLVQIMSRIHPMKVVLIEDNGGKSLPGVTALASLRRPSGEEPVLRPEWRSKINQMLRQVGFRAAS